MPSRLNTSRNLLNDFVVPHRCKPRTVEGGCDCLLECGCPVADPLTHGGATSVGVSALKGLVPLPCRVVHDVLTVLVARDDEHVSKTREVPVDDNGFALG